MVSTAPLSSNAASSVAGAKTALSRKGTYATPRLDGSAASDAVECGAAFGTVSDGVAAPLNRAPCALPEDYLDRWVAMAHWAVARLHGPAARYCLMFAFALQRSALADREHIVYRAPRLWQVRQCAHHRDPGFVTVRVSLLDDNLTQTLLDTVQLTSDFPTPLFPRTACGSQTVDTWAHGLACRQQYRGHTNFQALSKRFDLEAGPQWTPLEIFLVSLCVFRHAFVLAPNSYSQLIMNQLGVKTKKNALYHTLWFTGTSPQIGTVAIEGGQTTVVTTTAERQTGEAPAPP